MSKCIVNDENGVVWSVDEDDVRGWVGNREYAVIREGAKRIKVSDPNFVHEKRDFKGENPHPEFLPYDQELDDDPIVTHDGLKLSRRVNPLWEEWESSKAATERLNPFLTGVGLLMLFLIVVLVIGALV
jgi:hypothetical protein